MTRLFRVGLLLATFCATFASSASAQVLYGSIVGTVNDPSGSAVPAAAVTATNKQTGVQRHATSNAAGGYTFAAVQPGSYEVKVSKEGFRTAADQAVEVTSNNSTRIDMALQVGAVSESVNV